MIDKLPPDHTRSSCGNWSLLGRSSLNLRNTTETMSPAICRQDPV
jgi:hypothetical protein